MAAVRFPGLIDIHVHLRDPGATHKEDFGSAARAAKNGGFGIILDMPNNPGAPTVTPDRLAEKVRLADAAGTGVIIGFHFGTNGRNLDTFPFAIGHPRVFGLKLYTNHTTGDLLVDEPSVWESVFQAWESDKPILLHAEGDHIGVLGELAAKYLRRIHVCHVARKSEVESIRNLKKRHVDVSAGVTPHHLFLGDRDKERLGNYFLVKPEIGLASDRDALWEGLLDGTLDLIESDHAPHTRAEKEADVPAYGMPGLETTLGLMLKAYHERKVPLDRVREWLYDRPRLRFGLLRIPTGTIVFDPDVPYRVEEDRLATKCGWSPFRDWELYGKITWQ